MNGRGAATVLLAVFVALAGCGAGPSVTDDSSPSSVDGADGQTDAGSGPSSGPVATDVYGQPADGPHWQRHVFESGEVYHYAATNHETGESAEITWEIIAVQGSDVTSRVTFDDGTNAATWTVNGSYWTTLDHIRYSRGQRATATKAIRYLNAGLIRGVGDYERRDLIHGNEFTLDGTVESDFATAVVTGNETYAGIECFAIDHRIPDNGKWDPERQEVDACVAPDMGFPVSTVLVNSTTGDRTFEMDLSAYESG